MAKFTLNTEYNILVGSFWHQFLQRRYGIASRYTNRTEYEPKLKLTERPGIKEV